MSSLKGHFFRFHHDPVGKQCDGPVVRQGGRPAGFAVGIAALGAVLHGQGSATSYVGLFSAATVASAAARVAALVLLPAPAAASRK
jgi:hypothetical protein